MATSQMKRRIDKVDAQVPHAVLETRLDYSRLSVDELEELYRIVSLLEKGGVQFESLSNAEREFVCSMENKAGIK